MLFGVVWLTVVAALVAAVAAPRGFAFDRKPVTMTGLTPDNFGQDTTTAEAQLKGRYPGVSAVYCVGISMPGHSDSSFVQGTTRYWDKLFCSGYTKTTGSTLFTLVCDPKGAKSWIIYRLKGVTIAALEKKAVSTARSGGSSQTGSSGSAGSGGSGKTATIHRHRW